MLHGLDKISKLFLLSFAKRILGKQWNAFYYVHQRLCYRELGPSWGIFIQIEFYFLIHVRTENLYWTCLK